MQLLNTSLIQKHLDKALSLGQLLLLQKAVDDLKPPTIEPSPPATGSPGNAAESGVPAQPPGGTTKDPKPSSTGGDQHNNQDGRHTANSQGLDEALARGLDATTLLQLLGQPASSLEDQSKVKPHHTFDPFECAQARLPSKLYELKDFITLFPEPQAKTSVMLGEVELTIPSAKPKLDNISPLQYMEASLRILREMGNDGQPTSALLQYASYLIKVASMGQRFLWKSVIQYDTEYRKSQAAIGFPFGADSTYMMQLYLRENVSTSKQPQGQGYQASKPSHHPQTRFDPASGKPICGQFNTSAGCMLTACKYAHVCRSCFKAHSDQTHKQPATSTTPTVPKNL